jgi:hypothetical protein
MAAAIMLRLSSVMKNAIAYMAALLRRGLLHMYQLIFDLLFRDLRLTQHGRAPVAESDFILEDSDA